MPPAGAGGTVRLFGNLSPDGAVLKRSGRLAACALASRPRRRLRGPRGSVPSECRACPSEARRDTGKKSFSLLIKELPLSSGILSF